MRARGLAGHDAAFTRPRSVVRTRPSPLSLSRTIRERQRRDGRAVRTLSVARSVASTSDFGSNPPEPPFLDSHRKHRPFASSPIRTKDRERVHRDRSSSPLSPKLLPGHDFITRLERPCAAGLEYESCMRNSDRPEQRPRVELATQSVTNAATSVGSHCLSRATFSRICPRRPSPDSVWRAACSVEFSGSSSTTIRR